MSGQERPDRDGWDLAQEIDADQKRLGELDGEIKEATIEHRDARYQVLIADAKLKSVKAEIDIIKARMMAKMAILKALPR